MGERNSVSNDTTPIKRGGGLISNNLREELENYKRDISRHHNERDKSANKF